MTMEAKTRRERLERLLNLAQTYQGWTRKRLAQALGRDTTKLVPESGLPKLDLLMDLARVLDWSVEDVASHIWAEGPTAPSAPQAADSDFATLASESKAAHRDGRYADALDLARRSHKAASTGEERAIAAIREFNAWDGLGKYTKSLDACKRGLIEESVSSDVRRMLQVNLASAYYTLWQLLEGKTLAQDLIQRYNADPPSDRVNRVIQAFAYYVRGHSHRRLMLVEANAFEGSARQAKNDLTLSCQLYSELAKEFDESSYGGIANTSAGGVIEVQVALGHRTAESALDEYSNALDAMVDVQDGPKGDWLESCGWWCIFGCNVALRHVNDPRALQRYMALFTNKAEEIAERLDNWSMRERVYTMDYARRQRFEDWTGVDSGWTIDSDDVRTITGTMGRFPGFVPTGWRILKSAKVVREN